MAGDFNCIKSSQKKQGGRAFVDEVDLSEFQEFIEKNRLVDLGFVGPHSTWCNNRQGGASVWERIDRAFARVYWIQMHRRYQVLHLPRIVSDHRPMLVTTKVSPSYRSPF